jgi:fumarate hydratase class II
LKEAALESGYVGEKQFDEIVDPHRMVGYGVAGA